MKDSNIRNSWEKFTLKYQEFFQSNEEVWYDKLNEVIKYIIENNNTPTQYDKNSETKQLGMWLSSQKTSYKKEQHIMKDLIIRKTWEEFTLKYKDYLKDREEIWYDKLNELKKYIKENNQIPNKRDKNLDIKQIGLWASNQKQNYKKENNIMKDLTIKRAWKDFILKYQEYL